MASKRMQDDQNGSRSRPTKRSKASQACSTCRKHKTRCELLDTNCSTGPIQCHRCKVLNIECSFENSDIIILPKNPANPPGTAPAVEFNADRASEPSSESTLNSSQADSPPVSSESNNGILKVDDFVPNPRTPWGFLHLPEGFDWGIAPITAVQGLTMSTQSKPQRANSYSDTSLSNILTPTQLSSCLEIFETRYRPWMNLPISKESTPALDLARCTVASRHLDAQTRNKVAPRLQALVEKTILQPGYMAPSAEFIEALLILSLWDPLCGDGYVLPRDGRLLAMSAVEVALKLGFDRHSILSLRRDALDLLDGVSEDVKVTRLWQSASNIEHLLLLGSGKTPNSQRSSTDRYQDFLAVYTTDDARDMRLGLLRRLFDMTENGISIRFEHPSELERFNKEATETLNMMGWLHRLIAPLPVVSQFDSFYYNMLEINYHVCRLLILHNVLRSMRKVYDGTTHKMWFQVQHNGLYIAHGWTGDALYTAEAALIALLSRPDLVSLSTAPDHYFHLITFTCTFLVVARFAIYHIREGPIHGQTENLLAKTAERFQQAALSPDHLPNRCAEAIKELLGAWERRGPRLISSCKDVARRLTTGTPDANPQPQPDSVPSASQAAPMPPYPQPPQPSIPPVTPVPPTMSSNFASLTDPEVFFDTQFWSSFISNLNS